MLGLTCGLLLRVGLSSMSGLLFSPPHHRRQAGLLGLLLGDAAGVPFEFFLPSELAAIPRTHFALPFVAPPDFHRSHPTAPAGAWSDDGAHALALLDSLFSVGGLSLDDLGARLLRWRNQGVYAVDGRVFDIGIQTRRALEHFEQGVCPDECGPREEFENGNGALMRVLPLALWHRGEDRELVDLAHKQSLLTHGHARSQVVCALYCLWARQLLEGAADGWEEAVVRLRSLYGEQPAYQRELAGVLADPHRFNPRGSGYVVDCIWSARHAFLESPVFEEVIAVAIGLGRDTDTTAAVAGGVAGLRAGKEGLPVAWLAALPAEPILKGLVDSLGRS